MRSWSIPVGRLFGIEIRIHLTFLFLLFFLFSTEAAAQDATAVFRVLGLFGILFGSVVLHELGHALVARGAGIPAKGIILLPIGGITILDEAHAIPDPINAWKRDIRIAVAGPLVNLFIAGLSALTLLAAVPGISLSAKPLLHSSALLRSIVWANLYLGLFNLLPAYPMDGGRVLRALFMRRGDMVQATQRAVRIGHVFSILFMMVGILMGNWWLVMIGFFLFVGAQLEERSAVFQSVLQAFAWKRSCSPTSPLSRPQTRWKTRWKKPCTRCRTIFRWCAAATWWAWSRGKKFLRRCAPKATATFRP